MEWVLMGSFFAMFLAGFFFGKRERTMLDEEQGRRDKPG
jgi:hypothetical protein